MRLYIDLLPNLYILLTEYSSNCVFMCTYILIKISVN